MTLCGNMLSVVSVQAFMIILFLVWMLMTELIGLATHVATGLPVSTTSWRIRTTLIRCAAVFRQVYL